MPAMLSWALNVDMLFSSANFIFLFLPVTLVVFFLIPAEPAWPRKLWLLAASLYFYGYWKVAYVPLLLASIGGNYAVAELITRHRHRRFATVVFVLGISLNLGLLAYYKYTNFLLQVVGAVAHHHFPRLSIILPLAISF